MRVDLRTVHEVTLVIIVDSVRWGHVREVCLKPR
jgi:hypothetical protein